MYIFDNPSMKLNYFCMVKLCEFSCENIAKAYLFCVAVLHVSPCLWVATSSQQDSSPWSAIPKNRWKSMVEIPDASGAPPADDWCAVWFVLSFTPKSQFTHMFLFFLLQDL